MKFDATRIRKEYCVETNAENDVPVYFRTLKEARHFFVEKVEQMRNHEIDCSVVYLQRHLYNNNFVETFYLKTAEL